MGGARQATEGAYLEAEESQGMEVGRQSCFWDALGQQHLPDPLHAHHVQEGHCCASGRSEGGVSNERLVLAPPSVNNKVAAAQSSPHLVHTPLSLSAGRILGCCRNETSGAICPPPPPNMAAAHSSPLFTPSPSLLECRKGTVVLQGGVSNERLVLYAPPPPSPNNEVAATQSPPLFICTPFP